MQDPKEKAQAQIADDNLARAKGHSPEQVQARQRVAKIFAEMHLPADAHAAGLSAIDYAMPLNTVNGRKVDVNNPKSGFLGLGRRPAYLVSTRFAPKKPEDPIYALEYCPLKT